MKTTTTTLIPLIFTGLLLGGCDGTENPRGTGDIVERVSDYNGAYSFTATPNAGSEDECSYAIGTLSLKDGDVDGEAYDQNTGETISINGTIERDGEVKGTFDYSNGNNGTYIGVMDTDGAGAGTWKDIFGCIGDWVATNPEQGET